MASLADIFAEVRLNLSKDEEGKLRKKIANIDTKAAGAKVATRFGVGFNGAIGGIVSRSAGVFAAGFAAVQGVKVFAGFIDDARESARVARLTANVIKSTGGAAKVTADQVGDLATAISNKTGADDEAIQSGQNLLLTFTNIRNGVGKGNDIFNQASQAITDMAASMNGGEVTADGLKTSSIQLGKALNDPVKGITALSKVGVSFTADQKKQIKTLVDSGKTMEAQKVILGELQKEFGGAAAAAADPLTRLKTVAGNLSETVGGLLLPAVDKFANFAINTAIPGVQGLISAFQGEGVTSNGFVGFMEKVGVVARSAFGYFKSDVLPRLKEFGGFLLQTVVPAVVAFTGNLVQTFKPAVESVFGFFKSEVLPRLKDFAGFLGSSVLPKISQMATALSKNKDFLVPFVATIVTIIAAVKAWAIVQGILNVVLAANPIGLVVIAIAGLVAGIIYAYKHSEKFRDILQGAFAAIQKAAQIAAPLIKAAIDIVIGVFSLWWNYYAKPILKAFGAALTLAWGLAQKFGGFVVAAFNSIKEPAFAALKWVIGKVLDFVGNMLTAAAKAFGWVPGLGPKLKSAANEFGKFRDNVNAALNGVKDQTITVSAKLNAANINNKNATDPRLKNAYATGGPVFGAGSGTSDSIPALLSNGEHVWTAKEVQKAGGHAAVESMRKSVLTYAKGGAVGFDIDPRTGSPTRFANQMAAAAVAAVRPAAQRLANSLSVFSPGLNSVLRFVKSQVGKPYVWGGVGPGGYDCSGLVSAAINVALGRSPYRRLGATGSMPWGMFAPGPGAFEVGWFKGNPGHTAATVNGVNIESSGGRGVHMGSGARGARNSLFTNRAHVKGFARGGAVQGDLPYDLLDPRGRRYVGKTLLKQLGVGVYDTGGRWPSGTLGVNTSGMTETVIPGDGTVELGPRSLAALAQALTFNIDSRSLDRAITRSALNRGF